jgi:predicted CoA-binding protein
MISESDSEIKNILKSVKTIAIAGLSPDIAKPSHRVAKYLQEVGYKIVPIYPKEDMILGQKVYRSILDVPFEIDMIDMFRKPNIADEMVDIIKQRGDVKVLWLQKDIVNNSASKRAKDMGIKVVQNRCTMVEHKCLI